MATVIAASLPTETVMLSGVNDIPSRQLRISTQQDETMTQSAFPGSQTSSHTNLPPPNPPFVFPARVSPSSAPSSFSRATGRRPQSAIEFQGRSFGFAGGMPDSPSRSPALPDFSFKPGAPPSPTSSRPPRSPGLPDFSFNPGAALGPDESHLSPSLAPPSPRIHPNRNGHRRGGSEFVGGKLTGGGSITVMSTSPTRSEGGIGSPKLSPADGPPRRGHAHRRSAAISSHDLTMILKPNNAAPRGSSAPTSPAEFDEKFRSLPEPKTEHPKAESVHQEANNEIVQEASVQSTLQAPPSPSPNPRTRVGFSDTLEFIPRPLSMVSTDTSSTVTVRPGHRVSGSVSSVVSTNVASADRDACSVLGSPGSRAKADSRPSTAGAVLERSPSLIVLNGDSISRRRNSIPLLTDLPKRSSGSPTNTSPSKTPRRWSFFGLEPFAGTNSPTKSISLGSGSSKYAEKRSGFANLSAELDYIPTSDSLSRSESKKGSVRKKKQKRVRTWAGSILTRKPKPRKSKSVRRRSQTPPVYQEQVIEDFGDYLMDVPEAPPAPIAPVVLVTEPEPDPNMEPSRRSEDDISYPMIDLDAALGPFNTPSSRDPQWDEAQKIGAPPKRQLHSAAGLRGFSGPGMHYHRRAESAPEMPPFEAARFGIHRFGSSSTMADVFEEDEEEEEITSANTPSEESSTEAQDASADESESASSTEEEAVSTPTQVREHGKVSPKDILSMSPLVTRQGSGSSLDMSRPVSRPWTDSWAGGLREEIILEEPNYSTPRRATTFMMGAPGTPDSEAPSPRQILNTDIDPMDVSNGAFPLPATPYSLSYSSSFPSPRSPMSYDAQRISTAPSSIADENNYYSLLMGEPGPELVRISVDVPSLTSSNSTTTRDSTFAPGVQPRNMPFHDQRPASFSAAAFGRRRSSLVSLSRLISSAHGERSKLSMEVPLDSDPEDKPKMSKSKRFSRMLQFLKPKGSAKP
ncbi:uncharacterized protein F4812DRAFT_460351 [Daldinia caldariorum]|uniref:uncharacterized protein n=1 Tax=Daldinia caldariorum TaxID=326644 RepID=UPI0020081A14|nr:uncharacterized protein F4812DRAFT_460351 [Daldinia caldariorum]KAI1466792.1 hypothetical protein F4812DRAFT_460351 [Daldinia caldariorum]